MDDRIAEIRAEYTPLPLAYLDNAAAPLYPRSIPIKVAEYLCTHTLVNPHSRGKLGDMTSQMVLDVRRKVLNLFGADPRDYALVFTANATASIKLVGEALSGHTRSYPENGSRLVYLVDSHTSIVGLRGLSTSHQAVDTITADDVQPGDLVSWPMQSNFDGRTYPTKEWIDTVHNQGGQVLLDVAAWCSTHALDLSQIKPDFATVSFYKMFGLPDLGALLVRKGSPAEFLVNSRRYFGGGTVAALAPHTEFMARRPDVAEALEDGTLPIHTIAMLGVAIDEFARIFGSFDVISAHTKAVARRCWDRLRELGDRGVTVLSPDPHDNGPVVTFVLDNCGHTEFATAAAAMDIHVRAGTLCNIGAFTQFSGVKDEEIMVNHQRYGKLCNDDIDMLHGRRTGVVRASFGPYTSNKEVDILVDFVAKNFTKLPAVANSSPITNKLSCEPQESLVNGNSRIAQKSFTDRIIPGGTSGNVKALYIYPIKSCAGVSVPETIVYPDGLENDRQFCLVSTDTLHVLSLKKHLKMAQIKPAITGSSLLVKSPQGLLKVALNSDQWSHQEVVNAQGCDCDHLTLNQDPEVVHYFSTAVNTPCTLAKIAPGSDRFFKTQKGGLANSSPILLISETSATAIGCNWRVFRANVVIQSPNQPWCEDSWSATRIGNHGYELLGRCRRCNMVCVTPDGKSDPEPYLQLCRHRKIDGRLWFGQHMRLTEQRAVIQVGDVVHGH